MVRPRTSQKSQRSATHARNRPFHRWQDGKRGLRDALATFLIPIRGRFRQRSPWRSIRRSSTPSPMRRLPSRAWAATNPQRRARVMFKFLELVQKEFEPLAKLLSSEHGKTIPDARGDIQRGIEVVEFACGIPHLLKGEFTGRSRTKYRPLFGPPAAWSRRWYHAIQFSGNDPNVEICAGNCVRQCVHS